MPLRVQEIEKSKALPVLNVQPDLPCCVGHGDGGRDHRVLCGHSHSGCSRKCSAVHFSRRRCDPMTTLHLLCTTPHEGSAGGVVLISAIPLHEALQRRALTQGSLKLCRWSCGKGASAAQRTALRRHSHPAWTPLGTQQRGCLLHLGPSAPLGTDACTMRELSPDSSNMRKLSGSCG